MPDNLMEVVKAPLVANPTNSVVAFKDNSSAIRGFNVRPMLPTTPGKPSPLAPSPRDWDLLLTAETHNFPCAVAPYPGACACARNSLFPPRREGGASCAQIARGFLRGGPRYLGGLSAPPRSLGGAGAALTAAFE